jgi:hypothetical protein
MATACNIQIRFVFVEEEADGSACCECREVAWLSHYRVFVECSRFLDGRERTPVILCRSCHDAELSS